MMKAFVQTQTPWRAHGRSSWRLLAREASFLDEAAQEDRLTSRCHALMRDKAVQARRQAFRHRLDISHPARRQ